jgi:hypothetical protein
MIQVELQENSGRELESSEIAPRPERKIREIKNGQTGI